MMKTIYLYIVLLGLSTSSYAQDSLLNYLEIAAKNNPTVLQKFSEYQAALQRIPQVGSLPDPQLNIGVFLKPMELLGGSQVANIQLMQMFPWFGVLKNAKDEMSLMAKAKYESFRESKSQVFYDVQRTWFDLYRMHQDIQISEKNIEILRTIERLSLVKFKAASGGTGIQSSSSGGNMPNGNSQNLSSGSSGMQSMGGGSNPTSIQPPTNMQSGSMGTSSNSSGLVDLYRIQIEIGELENSIALLKNQQSTIVARFNSYLNRSLKSTVSIPEKLIIDTLGISLFAISDTLLANNPMLEMLKYEQQSEEARKRMVKRMGYPMIGLGLNYSIIKKSDMSTSSMNGKDMIMPMVTVTLPIYRKKYRAMRTEVDLMKQSTEQGYKATANSLQTEYYEAMQLFLDAQRRIKLYKNQSQLANNSLNIMVKSFSASDSNLTDILRIRQQTLDYELKQVEAVVDYNTAIAWLNRLMANTQVE